jgi:glycosyltransferase involved in cell wall biosynthesis
MRNTTITIAIPVLNGAKYIRKAIESALEQSQKADEILIVNNNSSDKTWSICETYGTKIKIISHSETLSMADNWTSCFELSTSEFVMICHADDELFPQAIEYTRNIISTNPEVDHIFGQTWLYNGERSFPSSREKFGQLSAEEYFLRSCASYYHYNSGTTTRRSLVLSIDGYSNQFKHITDVDFFIRLGLKARKVYAINEPLGTYRIHDTNLHKALNKKNIADYEYIALFKAIADDQKYQYHQNTRELAMKNLFPVLAQSITKALRQNNLSQAQDLSKKIDRLTERHGFYLVETLSKESKLIFNLCRVNVLGLNFAYLVIKLWENIHVRKNRNRKNAEYNLRELIKITQNQSCE